MAGKHDQVFHGIARDIGNRRFMHRFMKAVCCQGYSVVNVFLRDGGGGLPVFIRSIPYVKPNELNKICVAVSCFGNAFEFVPSES